MEKVTELIFIIDKSGSMSGLEADTIGGFICARLGRIPRTREVYEEPGVFRATILSADFRRIRKLRLEPIREEEEDMSDAE